MYLYMVFIHEWVYDICHEWAQWTGGRYHLWMNGEKTYTNTPMIITYLLYDHFITTSYTSYNWFVYYFSKKKNIYIYRLYNGCICIWFLSMSEYMISATSERSERVVDIIYERMEKKHIHIHPWYNLFIIWPFSNFGNFL